MTRHFWVLMHRYAGLAIAGFLLIAGLTGALLAFNEEIGGALNADLMRIEEPTQGSPMDPLVLRERIERHWPNAQVNYQPLHREPGDAAKLYVTRMEGPEGKTEVFYEVYAHPYTGAVIGERQWGAWKFDALHFMPLVYHLHYALTIPYPYGMWLFGAISFVWVFDCFVGFYLTLPRQRRPLLKNWKPAWLVKWCGRA